MHSHLVPICLSQDPKTFQTIFPPLALKELPEEDQQELERLKRELAIEQQKNEVLVQVGTQAKQILIQKFQRTIRELQEGAQELQKGADAVKETLATLLKKQEG